MRKMSVDTLCKRISVPLLMAASALFITSLNAADDPVFMDECIAESAPVSGRVVCADLAALEQTLVYNRFGSFNPYGMIFALRRDLASSDLLEEERGNQGANETITPAEQLAERTLDADYCGTLTGTETYHGDLFPGRVRLKDCKRPRPIVLRVNVGDKLLLRVTNYLSGPAAPDFSKGVCNDRGSSDEGRKRVRLGLQKGSEAHELHGEADCITAGDDESLLSSEQRFNNEGAAGAETVQTPQWPATRLVNLVAQGLRPLPDPSTGITDDACRGLSAVPPGDAFYCRYSVDQEGTYFFASQAAPAGGEGDGGSIVHGLFGAVIAERQGSRWYRSQVTESAMNVFWQRNAGKSPPDSEADSNNTTLVSNPHIRDGAMNYEAAVDGIPVLNMARTLDTEHLELVHTDLNAIIWCDETQRLDNSNCRVDTDGAERTVEPGFSAFREFSVFFS